MPPWWNWYTQQIKVLSFTRTYEFKSRRRYHINIIAYRSDFMVHFTIVSILYGFLGYALSIGGCTADTGSFWAVMLIVLLIRIADVLHENIK